MAKKMFDAAELLKVLNGNADPAAVAAMIAEAEQAVAEEEEAKQRKVVKDAIWSNVNKWKSDYLAFISVPDIVESITIKFNLDAESKLFEYDSFVTHYAGNEASDEMLRLVGAIEQSLQADVYEKVYDLAQIPQTRVDNINMQSAWISDGEKSLHEYTEAIYSNDFTADVQIADDKGTITATWTEKEGWKTDVQIGSVSRTSRTSSNGNITVPGYKTNKEYLMTIADQKVHDLLKEHDSDWGKINASQHIVRIEKTFTDDSKKLYHHAKGMI